MPKEFFQADANKREGSCAGAEFLVPFTVIRTAVAPYPGVDLVLIKLWFGGIRGVTRGRNCIGIGEITFSHTALSTASSRAVRLSSSSLRAFLRSEISETVSICCSCPESDVFRALREPVDVREASDVVEPWRDSLVERAAMCVSIWEAART